MPVLEKKTENARPGVKLGAGRLPVKRSINLATIGEEHINWKVAIPAIIAIVLAAGAFGKFGVADRLTAASRAEAEVASLQNRLDEGYRKIEEFGELNDAYAHYTYSGMSEEELTRQDRVAVMEMMERTIMNRTPVYQWNITGNQLVLNIDGSTLQDINDTVQRLQQEPIVDYCSVNTAVTSDYTTSSYQIQSNELVRANVVVYLKPSEGRGH